MLDRFDEMLTGPEGSPLGKTESPGTSEALGNTCASTTDDSSPSMELKPTLNLPLHETIVKPKGFSLEEIRLRQDFDSMAGVRKVVTHIPVDKPANDVFFQVRSGADWCTQVWFLKLKDNQTYIVHPSIVGAAQGLPVPTILYTAITRNGDIFLLPVKLPRADGKSNPWNDSRMQAVELAKSRWIKMTSNTTLGAYDIYEANGGIPEPEWPTDMILEDLLNIAFKDRIIQNQDDPVLRKLRGEI